MRRSVWVVLVVLVAGAVAAAFTWELNGGDASATRADEANFLSTYAGEAPSESVAGRLARGNVTPVVDAAGQDSPPLATIAWLADLRDAGQASRVHLQVAKAQYAVEGVTSLVGLCPAGSLKGLDSAAKLKGILSSSKSADGSEEVVGLGCEV